MGGVKVDLIWSPNHDDRFVTFGTDLSLFKVETLRDGASKPQGGKIRSCLNLYSSSHVMLVFHLSGSKVVTR